MTTAHSPGIPVDTPCHGQRYILTPKANVLAADGTPYRRRIALLLDRDNAERYQSEVSHRPGASIIVTDFDGNQWRLSSAPCGSGCHCAALAEPVEDQA